MKDVVKCNVISIDIEENDIVDIRAGGPRYLGYDYYVNEKETKYLLEFVKEVFKSQNKKYINIYVSENGVYKPKNKVWNKEKIFKDITGKELQEDNQQSL